MLTLYSNIERTQSLIVYSSDLVYLLLLLSLQNDTILVARLGSLATPVSLTVDKTICAK